MWQTLIHTNFSKIEWQNIYKRNYKTQLKKFAEFKYKILTNILSCGVKINIWNPNVSKYCQVCGESENIPHLLFCCKRLHGLWCIIGNKQKLSIKLKHIIFGLQNVTDKDYVRNLVIVITAFSIYKSWNNCCFNRLEYKSCNLQAEIKVNLVLYKEIFKYVLSEKYYLYLNSIIISPDESRGYIGFRSVAPPPPP